MTQRTRKERSDWVEVSRRTLVLGEFGEEEEAPRKERDDWWGTVMEGESWRQRIENWRAKEKRWKGRDLMRLKGEKDGSRGEERGGARPS
jgi:hypothetical protein